MAYNIDVPYLSNETIWEKADTLRKKSWGDNIPVDVELIAESDVGLYLTPVDGLKSKFDVEALLVGAMDEIVYDPKVHEPRLRFSIAHEIGHLILHEHLIRQLRPNTIEEWKETVMAIEHQGMRSRAEIQANEFAGRLLVPRNRLVEELQDNIDLVQIAREHDLTPEEINDGMSRAVCKKFHVSAEVIRNRLRYENIDVLGL